MDTIADIGEMQLRVEEYEGDIYIHVDVDKWSLSIYKRALIEFEEIKDTFRKMGYTRIRSVSPKGVESKLTEMFGMAHVLEIDDYYINEVLL